MNAARSPAQHALDEDESYKAEIGSLEEKEDRLFERFDSDQIDRATYVV